MINLLNSKSVILQIYAAIIIVSITSGCSVITSRNITSTATKYMISAANPLAAKAGAEILNIGGSAVDAAIAAQLVLTLVEPQSSGIGGGAFLMHYDAKTGKVESYDGREVAPRSAHPKMFLRDGKPLNFLDAATSGISVGVPGLLRMLELAHRDHGELPWNNLFNPAIKLAEEGFSISHRLAYLLSREKILRKTPSAKRYFYSSEGKNKPVGSLIKNAALAKTFRSVAAGGADAFYRGPIARGIVAAVVGSDPPGHMTLADIAAYRAVKRSPICTDYRKWQICGMGPPSSGGIAIAQIFGILENFEIEKIEPTSLMAIHLVGEASALAFADRNAYLADSDFIPVPVYSMIDKGYLKSRADLISLKKAGPKRAPGELPTLNYSADNTSKGLSTTHISVIDSEGNSVSMTSSIETTFGSRLMTGGFLLNNQLTDFSFQPVRANKPIANSVAPWKRPRSSMAPTLVLDHKGRLVMAIGSPGGSRIIGYVVKTLVAALDWKKDIQAAIDMPFFVNRNSVMELEKGTSLKLLEPGLKKLGHKVKFISRASGLHGIRIVTDGLRGGADKRREGVALGN
ncbi:MAG: gamma-glutamyltransferase [Magnetovibrio sp.]|nr:gamma-glutamyltransferase [Magnetovibrio sp.]